MHRVLVEDEHQEGMLTKNITQETVQAAIFDNIHRKRVFLAEDAPICSGLLRGQFGYNTVTKTAKAILAGQFIYPPDLIKQRKKYARNAPEFDV